MATNPYLGYGAIAASIGSTLVNAMSSYNSAKLARLAYEGQARVDEINAQSADVAVASVLDAGRYERGLYGQQYGQQASQQRVALANSGLDASSGSAAILQASARLQYEQDLRTMEINAINQAFGYKTQANNARVSSILSRGAGAGISPGSAAASSLLSGGATVAGQWYQYRDSLTSSKEADINYTAVRGTSLFDDENQFYQRQPLVELV